MSGAAVDALVERATGGDLEADLAALAERLRDAVGEA